MAVLWVSMFLLGVVNCQLSLMQFYGGSKAIFWGEVTSRGKMKVVVPIKGCLAKGSIVTVTGKQQQLGSLTVGQTFLVGGKKIGKNIGVNFKFVKKLTELEPENKRWLATRQDICGKQGKLCAGIKATACKNAQVCGPKNKFSKACQEANTCQINACDCSAQFRNKQKKVVCGDSVCPDGSKPLTCKANACSSGGCQEAVHCLPDSCNGCHSLFTDAYGVEVCTSSGTRRCKNLAKFNFGKGKKALGFGNINGICKVVRGPKGLVGGVTLFNDQKSCEGVCKCQELKDVDLGTCGQVLGFGVVGGECGIVKGCIAFKNSLKIALHPNKKSCQTKCPTFSPPSAPTKKVVPSRCPAGKPQQTCPDMCRTTYPPMCHDSRNKHLVCVTDSCGECSAKWLLDGKVFTCPVEPEVCAPGAYGCCPSGLRPRQCNQYQCSASDCKGAVSCTFDPCSNCAPVFLDANNSPIPGWMCRSNELASFQACSAGDKNCCASGYKPLKCPLVEKQDCPPISCDGAVPASCQSDPCNKCSLLIFDAQGAQIDRNSCEYIPDNSQCSKVNCPAETNTPACGPKPKNCEGVDLQCTKYNCACTWNWVITDIRYNPQEDGPWNACSAALQASAPCVAPQNCPQDFACDEPDETLKSQVDPLILKQLVCVQQPCTCQPVLQPPKESFRNPCGADDKDCCPDQLVPIDCPFAQANWTCSKITCGDTEAENCVADGCAQCGLKVYDGENNPIPHEKCRVSLDQEIAGMCAKVECPVDPNMSCPPRPSCYPEDWKLDCIVDPCSCRALWIDQDTRAKLDCSKFLQPTCVEPQDCPKKFQCQDLDTQVMADVGPEVLASLLCVQEPCTCRPIWTTPEMLPRNYRLPCEGTACCADGQGPLVCNPSHATATCGRVDCGNSKATKCVPDGCDSCNIRFLDEAEKEISRGQCSLPLDTSNICPGVTCPPLTGSAEGKCGTMPTECGAGWKLRCIRDPCVCSRFIWVDEDTRFAPLECTNVIVPACVAPEECPAKGTWSCTQPQSGNVPEGSQCVQSACTCQPEWVLPAGAGGPTGYQNQG